MITVKASTTTKDHLNRWHRVVFLKRSNMAVAEGLATYVVADEIDQGGGHDPRLHSIERFNHYDEALEAFVFRSNWR